MKAYIQARQSDTCGLCRGKGEKRKDEWCGGECRKSRFYVIGASEWNRETRHDKAENSWSNHCWYFKIIKLCGIYTLNHQIQLAGLCNSSNRYNSTTKTGSPLANFIPVRKWNRQHVKSRRIGTIRLKNPVHAEWAVPPPPLHRLQYHSAVTAKRHFSTSRGNKRQNCMFFFCESWSV